MPSMVSDVSAMLVLTMILRPGLPLRGGGAASKMRCCIAGGSVLYSGTTFASPQLRAAPPHTTSAPRHCLNRV